MLLWCSQGVIWPITHREVFPLWQWDFYLIIHGFLEQLYPPTKCISIQAPYFISFLSRSTIIRYSYCFWILLVLIDPFHAILSWISTYSSHLKLSTHSTSTIDFYVMCSTTQPHKHCFTFLLYFPVIHKHSFSYMCTSMKVRIFIKPCYSTPEMFPQDSASYHSDISKSICKFTDSVLTIPKKSA